MSQQASKHTCVHHWHQSLPLPEPIMASWCESTCVVGRGLVHRWKESGFIWQIHHLCCSVVSLPFPQIKQLAVGLHCPQAEAKRDLFPFHQVALSSSQCSSKLPGYNVTDFTYFPSGWVCQCHCQWLSLRSVSKERLKTPLYFHTFLFDHIFTRTPQYLPAKIHLVT